MKPNSYPKVLHLGHRFLNGLLEGDYIVEEKIDGSQISFGIYNGELHIRSKSAQLYVNNSKGMFKEAIEYLDSIKNKMVPGWTYRGEYLRKPKHNCLAYTAMPVHYIIIYDIEDSAGNPVSDPETKKKQAQLLGLCCVPFFKAKIDGSESIKELLKTQSCLGGTTIEGIVIKNYNKIFPDGGYMVGKYVSEVFKERQSKDWKKANPSRGDAVQDIILSLKTEARYNKAVQHLRDQGKLIDAPQDIGILMREIHTDIENEEQDYIKEKLYKYFISQIKRGVGGGFPEWYKERLLYALDYEENRQT